VRAHAASFPRFARFFRIAGALLFVASLAYFFVLYLTSFGKAAAGYENVPVSLTWNVTFFTLFALHHSVFARARVRHWVARTVPPELERSVYVWIASILFIAVCAWWRPIAGVAWEAQGVAAWTLAALQVAGIWLTLHSAIVLDFRELAGVKTPEGVEFTTAGPYGWVRHPIYAGWCLFVWGASPMTMTRLTFASVSCLYLLIAIPIEERTLQKGWGDAYGRYMARVRWRILPGVY
jgi:protein-S-isoprenylcysteine O-methyltransferase Ste14